MTKHNWRSIRSTHSKSCTLYTNIMVMVLTIYLTFPISQNEARVNPRVNNPPTNNSNNNPSQTVVTNQSIINHQPASSSVINPAANISNISANTGNVLRTLTNTFVPNIHTTTSNHVFGWANGVKKFLFLFSRRRILLIAIENTMETCVDVEIKANNFSLFGTLWAWMKLSFCRGVGGHRRENLFINAAWNFNQNGPHAGDALHVFLKCKSKRWKLMNLFPLMYIAH